MTRRVLVVGGGRSAEHGISLRSAAAIGEALCAGGFEVIALTIDRDGTWTHGAGPLGRSAASSLAAAVSLLERADVVFPAVHGPGGEDGTLAALCALARTPVVGSGLRAGAIGMDKWATKLVARAIGLRTAPGRLVPVGDDVDVGAVAVGDIDGDVVVKPVSAGSSHGVTLARSAAERAEALRVAARHDDRVLVEPVVRGREIDVAVLREADGRRWAAPPLEIHAHGLFDTATKYDGTARFTVPADLDVVPWDVVDT